MSAASNGAMGAALRQCHTEWMKDKHVLCLLQQGAKGLDAHCVNQQQAWMGCACFQTLLVSRLPRHKCADPAPSLSRHKCSVLAPRPSRHG
eukprot:scaffold251649_cov28-Tisochrysis_lutea.AAC.1